MRKHVRPPIWLTFLLKKMKPTNIFVKESSFEVPARLKKIYDAESDSNGFCSLLRSLK